MPSLPWPVDRRRSQAPRTGVPLDTTRWIAAAVELLAVGGAVLFAFLHTGA